MSDLLWLAGHLGWHLLPIEAATKRPLLSHGWHEASNLVRLIEAWKGEFPGCNWAVAFEPSGLVSFDLDTKGGLNGPAELRRLLAGRELPPSVGCVTQSGGLRLIFRHVGWPDRRMDLKNGIDVQRNSYGLIPPSEGYSWLPKASPTEVAVAALPDWVPALLQSHKVTTIAPGRTTLPVQAGQRHDYLARMAWRMSQTEKDPAVLMATLRSAVRDPEHVAGGPSDDEDRKLRDMVESALRKQPPTPPRLGGLRPLTKDDLANSKRVGTPVGLDKLDTLTGGLVPGEVTVVAARTSVGKTALLTQWALAADRAGKVVALFSVEMSRPQVAGRLARQGLDFADTSILVDDTSAIVIDTLVERATEARPDIVMVDYAQLVESPRGIDSRVQQVGDVSRKLKMLAMSLGIPVVAAAQVNRAAEQRSDGEPRLSDLRESGSLEQDADIVVIIHRKTDTQPERTLIVAKNRHGATGRIAAVWLPDKLSFGVMSFEAEQIPW